MLGGGSVSSTPGSTQGLRALWCMDKELGGALTVTVTYWT